MMKYRILDELENFFENFLNKTIVLYHLHGMTNLNQSQKK